MDDDTAILMRISRRDEDALKNLYAKYRSPLYNFLWQQLNGDVFLIEETLQDVFLAVWRFASSFRGESRVITWLFSIARNSATYAQSKKNYRQARSSLPLTEIPENKDVSSTDENLILNRLALYEVFSQLSEKHREIIFLTFVQGFSQEEIAQILEIPVGTVKSRLWSARASLQALLTGKES
jgi:RNA polymerase sigma factor (sigma-70 family)